MVISNDILSPIPTTFPLAKAQEIVDVIRRYDEEWKYQVVEGNPELYANATIEVYDEDGHKLGYL